MGILVIYINLMVNRYPEFITEFQVLIKEAKYKRSLLEGIDLNTAEHKIKSAMEIEYLYRDENLSLESLSKKLGLKKNQLSQFLNEKNNINFKTFIHEYRVNEAKELLVNDKRKTVLNIAYEVGFTSRSTFNFVFQKITGDTPSEYREKQLNYNLGNTKN